MDTHIALNLARQRGYDLIEVAPSAQPPVCKIMDYGKYMYEEKKREADARKKQVKIDVKEIKLRIGIADHDLNIKVSKIREFLEEGDRVKIILWFRGREIERPELGEVVLKKVVANIEDIGQIDQPIKRLGKSMSVFVVPQSKKS